MVGQMDLLVAIDALDDLVHQARPVPLTRQVRIDQADADAHVEAIRSAHGAVGFKAGARIGGQEVIDELAALIAAAQPIPLTDQVRIDREKVFDALDRLRIETVDPGADA